MTPFEKYGGFKTVSRIVMTFYEKVLDSDEIGDYFDGVEMARLIDHQTKFIASLMGGPASFTDAQLERLHAHLGLTHADFDAAADLLREALEEHDVAAEDVDVIIGSIEARRPVIVRREAS